VDLDPGCRAAVAASAQALGAQLDRVLASSVVRWVAPAQLHFTLRFLGEVSAEQAEVVRGVFREPWGTAAFTASIGDADLFPRSGAPRVIWLGMDEGREQMVALKTELDDRLVTVGFEPETRLFQTHLTLGRVKRRVAVQGADLRMVLSEHRPEVARWMVDRITLFESRLSSRGSTYHVVQSAMLAPSPEVGQEQP
jgi:2'-5' RNA ligase